MRVGFLKKNSNNKIPEVKLFLYTTVQALLEKSILCIAFAFNCVSVMTAFFQFRVRFSLF